MPAPCTHTPPGHTDFRAEFLLLQVCIPVSSAQVCTQHSPPAAKGHREMHIQNTNPDRFFPTNRQNGVLSAARKQSQFLYEQDMNCLKSNPICLAISLLSWLYMAPNTQHLAAQRHSPKQDNPQGVSKQKHRRKTWFQTLPPNTLVTSPVSLFICPQNHRVTRGRMGL